MKISIGGASVEIAEDLEADVRHAFMRQDLDATDEDLAGACLAYLIGTTAHILESEARAAAIDTRGEFLRRAGVVDVNAPAIEAAERTG